jgi:hypothetical protein
MHKRNQIRNNLGYRLLMTANGHLGTRRARWTYRVARYIAPDPSYSTEQYN